MLEIIYSMGRAHLMVNGIVVATEGDICRDPDIVNGYEDHYDMNGGEFMETNKWTAHGFKQVIERGKTE